MWTPVSWTWGRRGDALTPVTLESSILSAVWLWLWATAQALESVCVNVCPSSDCGFVSLGRPLTLPGPRLPLYITLVPSGSIIDSLECLAQCQACGEHSVKTSCCSYFT